MAAIGLFGFLSAFGSLSLSILLAMGGSSLPRWCHPFTLSISFFLCSILFAIWFNYLDAMALVPIMGAFLLAQAMM